MRCFFRCNVSRASFVCTSQKNWQHNHCRELASPTGAPPQVYLSKATSQAGNFAPSTAPIGWSLRPGNQQRLLASQQRRCPFRLQNCPTRSAPRLPAQDYDGQAPLALRPPNSCHLCPVASSNITELSPACRTLVNCIPLSVFHPIAN